MNKEKFGFLLTGIGSVSLNPTMSDDVALFIKNNNLDDKDVYDSYVKYKKIGFFISVSMSLIAMFLVALSFIIMKDSSEFFQSATVLVYILVEVAKIYIIIKRNDIVKNSKKMIY